MIHKIHPGHLEKQWPLLFTNTLWTEVELIQNNFLLPTFHVF